MPDAALAIDDVATAPRFDSTAMVDVVFLMIVFFAAIDFRVLEAKVDAFLPRDDGGNSHWEPPQPLLVDVQLLAAGTSAPDRRHTPFTPDGRRPRSLLTGHRVAWRIAGRSFDDLDTAVAELRRIACDPGQQVHRRIDGPLEPMQSIVSGYTGTTYEDVMRAADACRCAGFREIEYALGLEPR